MGWEDLTKDMQEFGRKLRLLEHFEKHNKYEQDISLVKNKSNFTPPNSDDKYLKIFLDTISDYPKQTPPPKGIRSNLSKNGMKALECLKADQNIIIKEADKGGFIKTKWKKC